MDFLVFWGRRSEYAVTQYAIQTRKGLCELVAENLKILYPQQD